jgi:hypothetical protein
MVTLRVVMVSLGRVKEHLEAKEAEELCSWLCAEERSAKDWTLRTTMPEQLSL